MFLKKIPKLLSLIAVLSVIISIDASAQTRQTSNSSKRPGSASTVKPSKKPAKKPAVTTNKKPTSNSSKKPGTPSNVKPSKKPSKIPTKKPAVVPSKKPSSNSAVTPIVTPITNQGATQTTTAATVETTIQTPAIEAVTSETVVSITTPVSNDNSETTASTPSDNNTETSTSSETSISNMFQQWIIFSITGGVCESKEALEKAIPKAEEEKEQLRAKIAYADQVIAQVKELLRNPNLAYEQYMYYEGKISEFEEFKQRVLRAIDEIDYNIFQAKENIREQKESFISLCASSFASQCMQNAPSWMNPSLQTIGNHARTFCEGQFESTLSWQCPYVKALKTCTDNYKAEKSACEEEEDTFVKAACYLDAWNKNNRCENNPPGYPGEPGTPTGIPKENEKYQAMFNTAIPACLIAISS